MNLGIKLAGIPPASRSVRDKGDSDFEVSRAKAMAKMESIINEGRSRHDSVRLVERLYEIKTGEAIRTVKLAELDQEWAKLPRRREPNARYASQCESALRRFAAFIQQV